MSFLKQSVRACGIGMFIALIVFSGVTIQPKKAEAIPVTEVGVALIKSTLTAASSAVSAASASALQLKELTLDPLAFAIAKKMLQQMTYSIIDWINSGFNGSPAFITDYKQFFLNAMDQVAGEFIEQELGFLCQPFQFDIKVILSIQLMQQRDFRQKSTCTLTGSAENVQEFVSGNFAQGGWKRWLEITTDPRNNFIGALEMSQEALRKAQEDAKDEAKTEALAGQGMGSFKICVTDSSGFRHCPIVTPGFAIADQLNRALGAGQDTLIAADEINEIISALFNQLAIQAVTGVNGLLGLSYSSDGGPSYMDAFADDIENGTTGGASEAFITNTIRLEERFRTAHENVMEKALDVIDDADASSCSAATNISNRAEDIVVDMATEIDRAETNIDALTELLSIFREASPDIKIQIAESFQEMTASGQMPTETDLALRQIELDDLEETLDGYARTIDTCN